MLTTKERIRSLVGNLKNWSWDVNPQFRIEKEDADALIEYFRENTNFIPLKEGTVSDMVEFLEQRGLG